MDFNMKIEADYHPLKLRHGFGFDKEDDNIDQGENQHAVDTRKINKMPFKVLDAPQL